MSGLPRFLTSPPRLLLFGGKGGVGKTTCATAAALHLAVQREKTVLLLSTDPAHSLGDRLDKGAYPDSLDIEEFQADAALREFRDEHRPTLHEIVARGTFFDDEDIQELLDLALPGMDETMSVLRLDRAVREEAYATIVVDTAPTGHTLRLLEMPDRFEEWVTFLDILLEKHRYMRSRFAGVTDSDPLDAFVEDLQARTERVLEALRDDQRTTFVAVTQPETVVLRETRRLLERLDELAIPTQELVLNRWPGLGQQSRFQAAALRAHREWLSDRSCWALPTLDLPSAADALPTLWSEASRLEPEDWSALAADGPDGREDATSEAPPVSNTARLPPHTLSLFAGKGGVGKTTLACATALRLADASPEIRDTASQDGRVLLLSTDPAHSLEDVLGTEVGVEPTPVTDRLDVLRVDASARLNRLRETYTQEVRQFFQGSEGSRLDLPHARTVTEHLMDLVPPSVDEIIGLTMTMEKLTENRYDQLVLDMAPTGHFFRFIEMPEVFEDWIRAFFELLRKYRRVIRAPTLKDRLVRLSKQVKELRATLTGAEDDAADSAGAVYGVATPGNMVLAETKRLAAHCAEGGIAMPTLFLNKVAPGSVTAENAESADNDKAVEAFREAFPAKHLTLVGRSVPPRGTDALRRWGRALYA